MLRTTLILILLCSAAMRQPEVMNHWSNPDRIRTVAVPPGSDTVTLPAFSASAVEIGAN